MQTDRRGDNPLPKLAGFRGGKQQVAHAIQRPLKGIFVQQLLRHLHHGIGKIALIADIGVQHPDTHLPFQDQPRAKADHQQLLGIDHQQRSHVKAGQQPLFTHQPGDVFALGFVHHRIPGLLHIVRLERNDPFLCLYQQRFILGGTLDGVIHRALIGADQRSGWKREFARNHC